MDTLLQVLISGLVVGCVYGMAAVGFTIVYNATRIINFANGEFVMLGGVLLAGAVVGMKLPMPLGIAIAIVGCALVGWVLQRGVLDLARNSDSLTLVMLTIGAALALRGAAALAFGRQITFVPEFGLLPVVLLGNVYVPSQGLWIVTILVTVSTALWYVFSRTMLGKAMRAASQEPRAAALCGIEPGHPPPSRWSWPAVLVVSPGRCLHRFPRLSTRMDSSSASRVLRRRFSADWEIRWVPSLAA